MKSNYKPLGKYIEFFDLRALNHELVLELDSIKGISSISKDFIKTKANLVGVVSDNYKVVEKDSFAYNPNTARMGDKIPIALNQTATPILVSSIYPTFKIKNNNELLPEFLLMWFKRPEFDRYARFMSHGSAREVFDIEEMNGVMLPIPHIDKQREIVKEYNTIQNRITLNQQLIQKLEETAQAIYREWFVEGIDLENLPEGWRKSKIGEEIETIGGGTPSTEIEAYWKDGEVFWFSPTDITNNNSVYIFQSTTKITKTGLNKSSAKLFPPNCLMMTSRATVGKLAINTTEASTNQGFITMIPSVELNVYYLYSWMNTQIEEIINLASGSTFLEISKSDFRNLDIVIPSDEINLKFKKSVEPIFDLIKNKTKENHKLTELKGLLLSKMATVE